MVVDKNTQHSKYTDDQIEKLAKKLQAQIAKGMTDLIRPALYQAFHKIENLTSDAPLQTYDVVGPICELVT